MSHFLLHLIGGAGGDTTLLALAIILCAFVFEDLTTVIVGVLAADGIISIPLALVSLYIGIASGDMMLYSLGVLARTHPRLAHYIDHDFTAPFRLWLEKRYVLVIFSGHFVPGLRFTSYVASGFFRYPLSRFIRPAIAGGLLLGTALFFVSYWFGSLTSEWVDSLRWGIALVFLLVLFLIGRHTLAAYRATQSEQSGL